MTFGEKIIKRLEELLCSDRKEGDADNLQTATSLKGLPFILPLELQALLAHFSGWNGYIGGQYFHFFGIDECKERTAELGKFDLPKSLVAIGDNGASEIFFVDEVGNVSIGDEIGLPESLVQVSRNLLDLLDRPQKIDEALSR